MPEGHSVHRIARQFRLHFVGNRVAVSSPQGRFVAGAAQLDGLDVRQVRAGLEARIGTLEEQVARLETALQALCDQLGVSPLTQPQKHDRADNPSAGSGRSEN